MVVIGSEPLPPYFFGDRQPLHTKGRAFSIPRERIHAAVTLDHVTVELFAGKIYRAVCKFCCLVLVQNPSIVYVMELFCVERVSAMICNVANSHLPALGRDSVPSHDQQNGYETASELSRIGHTRTLRWMTTGSSRTTWSFGSGIIRSMPRAWLKQGFSWLARRR
jgi:hypothetical protein